jgi:hypothetical protein
MSGVLVTAVASFMGSTIGIAAGGVATWHYYIKPRMARVGKELRAEVTRPAPSSQVATATTPGFMPHDGPVTVGRMRMGGIKRALRS